ncbi:MAG: putative sulfate exporter family transporter [Acidimicrobiia bacterium]|nr:putative sulfate exporter family transporter [Acidimicrobiia bacterium]
MSQPSATVLAGRAPAQTDASAEPRTLEAERPPLIGEDWLAVLIGGAMIALVLVGLRPAMPRFAWGSETAPLSGLTALPNLTRIAQIALLVLGPVLVGASVLRVRMVAFLPGLLVVYALAVLAQVLAGYTTAAAWGLEYVIFALAIGLIVNHTSGVPEWLREAVRTEFYIKTGLVVLGATILFNEIVQAGLPGILQALVVVLTVWTFCFWLCRRMRVDDELSTMLASAVSICGVSAAIAACGAIQGDRKKLSYVTSLVLLVAMPMMVLMPWIARATDMSPVVAGAWLGGTLDTSAAVVAAGEMLGDAGRNAAVVVKLSQNALIGLVAFALTVWWAIRNKSPERPSTSLAVIWERFPKFVFGFLLESIAFSFLVAGPTVASTKSLVTGLRTALFAMAFVSIGLETHLGRLVTTGGGRPAIAFLGGQAFNVGVTLIVAYLLFGGLPNG